MTNTVQTNKEPNPLAALAREIKSEYAALQKDEALIIKANKSSLSHALIIGQALAKAKVLVKHGEWSGWVQTSCPFGADMAAKYMRVAEIEATKSGTCSGFAGGIAAFLKEHATPRAPATVTAPRSPAPAAPKEAAPADTVSTPAPALYLEADKGAAPIDDLSPEESRELERALLQEEAKPAPAPEPQPRAHMRDAHDAHDADVKALKEWQKGTGDTADIRLIAAVRAAVRAALIAGQSLASEEVLAEKVGKILKRDLSPAIVTAAYRQMLELQAPGGPLCIFRKTAPRGATAADMANVRDTARKIAERREREAIEAQAKRQADEEFAKELDLNESDLPTEPVITELALGEGAAVH